MLRQNLPWVQIVSDPPPREIERVARTTSSPVYALFDLETMPRALAAARLLHGRVEVIAVRGRVVPAEAMDGFDQLWPGPRLLDLLVRTNTGLPIPDRWRHPLVTVETWRHGDRAERLGVVFTRLPEPGVLDVGDLGRDGVRPGTPAAQLDPTGTAPPATPDVSAADLPPLLREFARLRRRMLLVDNGGAADPLARALDDAGVLGGYLGTARRPVPDAVLAAGVPVYTWFEPEDLHVRGRVRMPNRSHACAFVPVGLPGQDMHEAEACLRGLRAEGFAAVVPRFHLPVPATHEWHAFVATAPLRHRPSDPLDGSYPIFALPGWDLVSAPAHMLRWGAENRWPPPRSSEPAPLPQYSIAALRVVLDGYVQEGRSSVPEYHGRDLMGELLKELGSGDLEPHNTYPFLAWQGETLLAHVNRAVEARLRSVTGAPEALCHAVRHTALAGGKRIRPILALAIARAHGVPLEVALAAALSLEWLHTASLVQDDLPCMDDDPVRRRTASAHVRHGEGLALLASDALVAMAFEDLAALARLPAVGAERAAALVAAVARELGATGTVGGQALDLLARERGITDLRTLVEIHRHKTAPLFRLAATIGAILADLPTARRTELEAMLASLGVAFQIVDDLLDATASPGGGLGRPPGSDARDRRATFATVLRRESALGVARRLVVPLVTLGRAEPFRTAFARLAQFVVVRSG